MKWSQQGYRIFFNLFSGLSMLLVLALQFRHQAAQVVAIPMLLKAVALILMLFSVYMLKQSFKNYRLSVFIGIERETQMDFSITGLNAYMRHPLYFFSLMAFLSLVIVISSSDSVQMFIASFIYVQIGYRLEEKKLVALFGKAYIDYQKDTPALLPSLSRKNRAA
jgi:methanethiol S-methyltransferase